MRAILVVVILAGCTVAPPAAPALVPLAFAPAEIIDAAVDASEPDIAALPDGTLLACALERQGDSEAALWRKPPSGSWEPIEPPPGGSLVDCAWDVDAGGMAYYATSAGDSLVVGVTWDGRSWDGAIILGLDEVTVYDRPWVAGGEAGQAIVAAYSSREGLLAWRTSNGGASWDGPFFAGPEDALIFQSFSDLAWIGNASFAYAFGPLEPDGPGVAPRDVWLALTHDGGESWTFEEIAPGRGNLNNVFPSIAARRGSIYVAWAESGPGGEPVVAHLLSGAPGAWGEPLALHGPERTAIMPRVLATDEGPLVVMYAAQGRIQPSFDEATWDVLVVRGEQTLVVASGVHEGSVATGGYGQLAGHFAGNPGELGTQNSQELLHDLGAALLPDGGVALAWANTTQGTRVAWTRSV